MAYFEEAPVGVLVALEPNEMAGLEYHVWFPYAREFMDVVREGSLVAIRNFASRAQDPRYSILELVQVLPIHYALGSSAREAERAFPGFVTEAARSARQDWEQESPTEETTQIRCVAIPTGVELAFSSESPDLSSDEYLPMQGEDVHVLLPSLVSQIMNRGLLDERVQTVSVGTLVQTPEVEVLLKTHDLLRTHFGVFGFTGSGKSNLMSTLVRRLVTQAGVRVVLFDLMGEYIPLLSDVLDETDRACVVSLDAESIPGGETVRRFLWGEGEVRPAADAVARTQLLPRELIQDRERLSKCVESLLDDKKIRVWDPGEEAPPGDELYDDLMEMASTARGSPKGPIQRWIGQRLGEFRGTTVELDLITEMAAEAQAFLDSQSIPNFMSGSQSQRTLSGDSASSEDAIGLTSTAVEALYNMRMHLTQLIPRPEDRPPEGVGLGRGDLLGLFNTPDPALIVFQCDNDDELRKFSSYLVNVLFYARRRAGRSGPPVLFIYDEADEFIPGQTSSGTSYASSRAAAAILARRGRKFGMGIGIATQRVAYLDTSILAQPHTYFVSKLPREYDRNTMAEAFGITEDMMRRTLRFRVGDWLLVSFDATGLVNVPIPVHLPNANDAIREHLDGHGSA